MMRNPTTEEIEILDKLDDKNLTKEGKDNLIARLKEIDEIENKGSPFSY